MSISCHNQFCIQLTNANSLEISYLKRAIMANHIDDIFYKMKQNVHPFLQGIDEQSGWILIEFWTNNKKACQEYICFLNDNSQDYRKF